MVLSSLSGLWVSGRISDSSLENPEVSEIGEPGEIFTDRHEGELQFFPRSMKIKAL